MRGYKTLQKEAWPGHLNEPKRPVLVQQASFHCGDCMRTNPRLAQFDSTLSLLRDPYHFVEKQCRRLGTDVFASRLMLQRAVFMHGPPALELFYDPARFVRAGAAPHRLKETLFGQGTVQNLDGAAHHQRKAMFVRLLTESQVALLAERFTLEWKNAVPGWQRQGRVQLYPAIQPVLMRAVCGWADVPVAPEEVDRRTGQVAALFDGAGAVGPRHWRSRLSRKQAEHWLAETVEAVRAGRQQAPTGGVLHTLSMARDGDGGCALLPARTAAAELLNVLRPTIAIAVYITFIAHALHQHPHVLARLRGEASAAAGYVPLFVNEVRRWYPFFPSVVARVKSDFSWGGHAFKAGTRTVFDLYGTNHDARAWTDPAGFRPERFEGGRADLAMLVPQGGGALRDGHRCPGELITIALMAAASNFLARQLRYTVPAQDLAIDERRLPALPRSRFVMSDIGLADNG